MIPLLFTLLPPAGAVPTGCNPDYKANQQVTQTVGRASNYPETMMQPTKP